MKTETALTARESAILDLCRVAYRCKERADAVQRCLALLDDSVPTRDENRNVMDYINRHEKIGDGMSLVLFAVDDLWCEVR